MDRPVQVGERVLGHSRRYRLCAMASRWATVPQPQAPNGEKTPEALVKRAQVKVESPGGDFDDNPVRRARNNTQTRAGRDHVQRYRRLYGNNGPRRAAGDARLGGPSRTSALAVARIQRPDAGRNW